MNKDTAFYIETDKALELKPNKIIISNKTNKDYKYKKIEIRKAVVKKQEVYQMSCYTEKQVFQKNYDLENLKKEISEVFPDNMKQMNIFLDNEEIALKASKSGQLLKNRKITKTEVTKKQSTEHNRKKNYIFQEGMLIEPLVDMGIFTKEGKVVKSMYDKYKQINRFIELVDDILKDEKKQCINIIDFGCSKSYLTFLLYYYIVEIKKKDAHIIGLDLKEDVIKKCNCAALKYGYNNLKFHMGDINGYKTEEAVDMVVTLHACDTATDYALYNAVNWNAKYILSVPCCQHEVNKQIKCSQLEPMMKYGIIKERMSALATDSIRGNMLEYCGYKTQLLEFVDMAHSPKNILIRAVKSNIPKTKKEEALAQVEIMCETLHINPMIYKLLKKEKGM